MGKWDLPAQQPAQVWQPQGQPTQQNQQQIYTSQPSTQQTYATPSYYQTQPDQQQNVYAQQPQQGSLSAPWQQTPAYSNPQQQGNLQQLQSMQPSFALQSQQQQQPQLQQWAQPQPQYAPQQQLQQVQPVGTYMTPQTAPVMPQGMMMPQQQQQQQQLQQPMMQQQQQPLQQQLYYAPNANKPAPVSQPRAWVGTVTQLIPPNYGIVDGTSFYVHAVVQGGRIPQIGDRVKCEAIANTDGGQYQWRCTRVEVEAVTVMSQVNRLGVTATGSSVVPNSLASAISAAQAAAAAAGLGDGPASRTIPNAAAAAAAAAATAAALSRPRTNRFSVMSTSTKEGGDTPALKYNSAPPPILQYNADVALALAANAVDASTGKDSSALIVQPASLEKAKAVFNKPTVQISEDGKKRSEEVLKQLSNYGDPGGIGAKLLGKMGFGAVEGGKGGLGLNEQGIAAPVDPKSTSGNRGLGFADERGRERDRKSNKRRHRSRSGSDSRSPSSSRSRSRSSSRGPSARYAVQLPKAPTFERVRGLASISKRYKELYIPGDFCRAEASWLDYLRDFSPLPIAFPLAFNVMGSPPPSAPAPVPPSESGQDIDALGTAFMVPTFSNEKKVLLTESEVASGRRWSAKVMMFSGVPEAELHTEDPHLFQHPSQKLRFLVGQRGKPSSSFEFCALGGAWDPVDGGHPARDKSALIRTAIRTFKECTGVDLSPCLQWIRMVDIIYARSSLLKKTGSSTPSGAHTTSTCETGIDRTVMFVVDGWSVSVPNPLATAAVLAAKTAEEEEARARAALQPAAEALRKAEEVLAAAPPPPPLPAGAEDLSITPTALTVAQLQEELQRRSLDTKWDPLKGGRKVLEVRLQEYLDRKIAERRLSDEGCAVRSAAQAAMNEAKEAASKVKLSYDAARDAAKEAARALKDPPPQEAVELIVGPELVRTKASLSAPTLESLLEYREEDNKEAMFEVSLFAEMFKEMLQTRFGLGILRTLPTIAAPPSTKAAEKRIVSPANNTPSEMARTLEEVGSGALPAAPGLEEDKAHPTRDSMAEAGDEAVSVKNEELQQKGSAALEEEREHVTPAKEVECEPEHVVAEVQAECQSVRMDIEINADRGVTNGNKRGLEQTTSSVQDADASEHAGAQSGKKHRTGSAEHSEQGAVHLVPCLDNLSLACRFFDTRCVGYLEADDLEEMLYMVSSSISRKQIQSLVDSVQDKKGRFSYMQFGSMKCTGAVLPTGDRVLGTTVSVDDHTLKHGGSLSAAECQEEVVRCDGSGTGVMSASDVLSLQQKAIAADARRREAEVASATASAQLAEVRASENKLRTRIEALQVELQLAQKMKVEMESKRAGAEAKMAMALTGAREAQKLLQGIVAAIEPTELSGHHE
ncbi:hypothetical protein CEUSTIGMA_g5819.t1 [Chlamydomonas eustigma]|uniref:G-patch domain-containing protein n=1 Tax=Chlamydomonas eustigma TaxID=1157962 RepID=A0A250X5K7_9CHLO|nr:hypothetical protein CEUSTIGMA_g5819.t1 [Chlamydomonas eustigma]|eukprot:GAX78377.1 hypothetical protein CEUSTIGMA_g5819.t1 [Chlamydomonas eustigma]